MFSVLSPSSPLPLLLVFDGLLPLPLHRRTFIFRSASSCIISAKRWHGKEVRFSSCGALMQRFLKQQPQNIFLLFPGRLRGEEGSPSEEDRWSHRTSGDSQQCIRSGFRKHIYLQSAFSINVAASQPTSEMLCDNTWEFSATSGPQRVCIITPKWCCITEKWYRDETETKSKNKPSETFCMYSDSPNFWSANEGSDTCTYALCFPSDMFVLRRPALSGLVCHSSTPPEDEDYSELGTLS